MADINVIRPKETNLHVSRGGNVYVPYLVERKVTIAELDKIKGSATANGDKVQILKIPANSAVLASFVGIDKELKATALTVSVDADGTAYVTGADLAALTLNQASATIVTPAPTTVVNEQDKVVELTLTTVTGAAPEDAIRVSFLVVDVSPSRRSDIAQLVR